MMHVEQLLKEHKKLEEKSQVCFLTFLCTGREVAVDNDGSCPVIAIGRLLKDTGMPSPALQSPQDPKERGTLTTAMNNTCSTESY